MVSTIRVFIALLVIFSGISIAADYDDDKTGDELTTAGAIDSADYVLMSDPTDLDIIVRKDIAAILETGVGTVTQDYSAELDSLAAISFSANMLTFLAVADYAAMRTAMDVQVDLDVPSQAEAEAGVATTERVWTSERIAQAIASQAADGSDDQTASEVASTAYGDLTAVTVQGAIEEIEDTKVSQTGDTITGNLILDDGSGDSPSLQITNAANLSWNILVSSLSDAYFYLNDAVTYTLYIQNFGTGAANLYVDGTIYEGGIALSSTYEAADTAIAKTDEAETVTGNWVNTTYPWADNEVADDISLTNITQITTRPWTSLTGTNWRMVATNGSGVPTEVSLGADGTYLMSNGAAVAPTFEAVSGSGTMTSIKVGDTAVGGSDIITLDFNEGAFAESDGGESPDTEVNISARRHKCSIIEDLAAADDNMNLGSLPIAVTITKAWCKYRGTGDTPATISFEDEDGNGLTTSATLTCQAHDASLSEGTGVESFSAGNTLIAYESLYFDVDNAVSPETDTYEICVEYTID